MNNIKQNKAHIVLFILLAIFVTRFFDYCNWNPTLGGQISYFVYFFIFLLAINRWNKISSIRNPFKFELMVLTVSPILTFFSQMFIYNEGLDSIKLFVYCFIVSIFYVFYVYSVSEKEIVVSITIIALVIAFIQIFQQFFPSTAMFGLGDTTNELEIRNGILRYRLTTIYYTTFAMFYFWSKAVNNRSQLSLSLFILFAISDYLYLTRQYILGMAVALIFSYFYIKDYKTKRMTFILILITSCVIVYNSDSLLSFFIESSKNDLNEDNIRIFAYSFYWEKIIETPVALLFGNGFPKDLTIWQENYRLFVSDIGIVGQWFTHGIFWVLAYFTSIYKILWKYKNSTPLYIKLFALCGLVHCPMVASFGGASTLLTWLSVLYISSLYINKKMKYMNFKV